jgi:hypothetical protein
MVSVKRTLGKEHISTVKIILHIINEMKAGSHYTQDSSTQASSEKLGLCPLNITAKPKECLHVVVVLPLVHMFFNGPCNEFI